MDHIMTYEEYLRDVKKGIVTDLGNSPVTPLLLMLQGKWKTQILYELCIHDTVSAVLYRCEATEVNIPYHYDDGNVHMNHVIRLKNLDQYNPSFPQSAGRLLRRNDLRAGDPRYLFQCTSVSRYWTQFLGNLRIVSFAALI